MPRKAREEAEVNDKEFVRDKRDRDAEYKQKRSRKSNEGKFDRKRARQRDSERSRCEEYLY